MKRINAQFIYIFFLTSLLLFFSNHCIAEQNSLQEESAVILDETPDTDESPENMSDDIIYIIPQPNELPTGIKLPLVVIDGFFKTGATYNFAHGKPESYQPDWRGLSSMKCKFQLDIEYKFHENFKAFISGNAFYDAVYYLKGRDQFSSALLNHYEKEAEFGEVYIQGAVSGNIDIKIGRQILEWGSSDNIRVTDILNPVDNRFPGLQDVSDLKMPLFMSRLDYEWHSLTLTGVAIHEIRFDKLPCYGSDFYFFSEDIQTKEPSSTLDNTEFAFAANLASVHWDVSFYLADTYDDRPYAVELSPLTMEHARIKMAGAEFNLEINTLGFKVETAYLDGLHIILPDVKTFSRTDALLGVAYTGIHHTIVEVETALRHINQYEGIPQDSVFVLTKENTFQSIVKYTRYFLNERMDFTFLASIFGKTGEDGAFQRISTQYHIADDAAITCGVIFYSSGDMPEYDNIGNNDRFFLDFQYNF